MFRDSIIGNLKRLQSVSLRPFRPSAARPGSAKQLLLITLGCAVVLGGFYSLSLLGPRQYESASRRSAITKEQAERLRTLADEAEARWDALKKARAEAKASFTDDDLRVIGEAAISRFQYENQVDGAGTHYLDLKKELHDRSGERLRAESVRLEKLAAIEEREQRWAAAQKLYGEALATEERLNTDFEESSFKNLQRTNFLASRVRVMIAKPLWDRSVESEKAGDAAVAKGDLTSAIAAFDIARRDNFRLEQEFRGLTRADSFRTRKLERRLDTLRSTTVRDRALARITQAETDVLARNFANLAVLRAEAEAAVRELTETYRESEYAAPDYVAGLTRRAQNAASAPEAEAVEHDLVNFEVAVRAGNTAAAGMIEGLQRSVQRMRELFPASDRIGAGTAERVAFLFEHRTEIAIVGSAVKGTLLPMPGRPQTLALTTETPQRLYTLVMGDNPSASKGEDRPVESLTRTEARTFCKRLGWLLARTVRLPDEAEFTVLAGKPDAAALAKIARIIDNSDGRAAPIPAAPANEAGFRDLFGNVAEWIDSPSTAKSDDGIVAGGDAESTASQLVRSPFRRMMTGERSRFVGFRFIVETPASTR
jgi:hypothetical protein